MIRTGNIVKRQETRRQVAKVDHNDIESFLCCISEAEMNLMDKKRFLHKFQGLFCVLVIHLHSRIIPRHFLRFVENSLAVCSSFMDTGLIGFCEISFFSVALTIFGLQNPPKDRLTKYYKNATDKHKIREVKDTKIKSFLLFSHKSKMADFKASAPALARFQSQINLQK